MRPCRRSSKALARATRACLALTVLVLGCGTTTRTSRLHVAVHTDPPDATVVIRHGEQELARGPAPLVLDETRDVTVRRRGGYWAALAGAGVGLIAGTVMVATSGDGSDGNPAIGKAISPLAFGPALVLGIVGAVGLALTQEPPFTASAMSAHASYPVKTFEPGDDPLTIDLKASRGARARPDSNPVSR